MNRYLATAATLTCLLSTSALAQHRPLYDPHHHTPVPAPANASATGTGVGIANSSSQSGAVAISGQGGQGGNSALTINNPANTRNETVVSGTTTQNVNQNVSGSTTSNINSRVSGTTTVKNAPSVVAPGLTAAGLETCLGSASGTVSAVGFGIGGGSTYKDEDCTARLDSRTLFAMGLKGASVARLCQRPDIWRSMPDICQQYWPVGVPLPHGIVIEAQLVAPRGTYMSATVEVIDGKSGRTRPCSNYSETKQKCFSWADEPPRRQRTAAITPHRPVTSKPAASKPSKPSPAVEAIETAAPAPSNQ